jgi:pimeloyl-ACP methyl ester carboxylesterase
VFWSHGGRPTNTEHHRAHRHQKPLSVHKLRWQRVGDTLHREDRTVRACYLAAVDAYLRYLDLPGREPVRVYLPGLGYAAAASFAHVAAHRALVGHRSLLVDFLGFGLSDKPRGFGYTLNDHAETVVTLLDQLGLRKCVVIGHSLGGAIAVLIAARRPDLVAALVVADGNLDPGGGGFSASIAAQSESAYVGGGYLAQIASLRERARAGDGSEGLAAFVGMLQVASPAALYRTARCLVEMPRPTVREHLELLALPRTFLVGSRTLEAETSSGAVADWDYVRGLSDAGVQLLVVPNAGHGMMSDNPDGFVRTIVQALRPADR